MDKLKGLLFSKTFYLMGATLLGAKVPAIEAWITAHVTGTTAVALVAILGIVVRWFTDQSLADKGAK